MEEQHRPLSGRRAEAARNNERILTAARAVFTDDPEAPIAAVAERAGVGISALYRRYRSKDELLQRLASDGLRQYLAVATAALADAGEPWAVFSLFMQRCVEMSAGSLTLRHAGSFTATEELRELGMQAHNATQQILERTKAAGGLRPEIEVGDLSLLFEQLQAIRVGDEARTAELRRRYLALLLDGLRALSVPALPGPAPQWAEINRRYDG
ncbi:MAG TPA: helix-turn-helix domain-containing protein [Roseiflexaceae bacterium]|nr:helix-turn-helix domain-containing protein [Roseiflexaceae bacterium]